MRNVLFVMSSPRNMQSYSYRIAHGIVDELKSRHSAAKIVVRNLAKEPVPHVGVAFVDGLYLEPGMRNATEAKALAISDALIDELKAADVLVLAVPMHNFGLPSVLKAWIDQIVRAGHTFFYSEKGAEGLLKGKKAILVLSRGGVYSEEPMKQLDFQEPYLRAILAFVGITDVHVVRIEGLAMGANAIKNAIESAKTQSEEVVREIA